MNKYGVVTIPGGCDSRFKPHAPHHWREGFLWHRRVECPGIKETERDPWIAANPAMGYLNPNLIREMAGFPAHKHSLKLTRWSWAGMAPFGQYDQICELTFTCKDEDCDFEHTMRRWEYDKLVLRSGTKKYEWPM